ncbi:tol-Pal system protein TolA-like [Odontomachus brunneus]|uniref:tol-Pal system protein TolA-like n=1 Tax=Odontomachus brunneus TaxID=486640 RepID=UPI0013F26019|nr:tol-Pal system protein TolA-like [Odontomachus brunneus]
MKIPAILVTSLFAWGLANGDFIGSKSQTSASATASASANAGIKDMWISVPLLKKRSEHHKDIAIDKSVFDIKHVMLGAVDKINGAPKVGLGWKEVSIGLENAKTNAAVTAEALAINKEIVAHRESNYLNAIKLAAEASNNALAVAKMAEETQKIAEAKGRAASKAIYTGLEASSRAEAAAAATRDAIDRAVNNAKSSNSAQTYANVQAENSYRNSVAVLAALLGIEESSAKNTKAATKAAALTATAAALHAKANAVSQANAKAAGKATMSAEEAQAVQSSALRNQQLAAAMLEKANADEQATSARSDYDAVTNEAKAAAQASAINAFRDGIIVGLGNDGGASAQEIAQVNALARAGQKGNEKNKIISKKGMHVHKMERASASASASASAEASSRIMGKKW